MATAHLTMHVHVFLCISLSCLFFKTIKSSSKQFLINFDCLKSRLTHQKTSKKEWLLFILLHMWLFMFSSVKFFVEITALWPIFILITMFQFISFWLSCIDFFSPRGHSWIYCQFWLTWQSKMPHHIILNIIPSQLERTPQPDAMPFYLIQVIVPVSLTMSVLSPFFMTWHMADMSSLARLWLVKIF